jgi:hypothetical protein
MARKISAFRLASCRLVMMRNPFTCLMEPKSCRIDSDKRERAARPSCRALFSRKMENVDKQTDPPDAHSSVWVDSCLSRCLLAVVGDLLSSLSTRRSSTSPVRRLPLRARRRAPRSSRALGAAFIDLPVRRLPCSAR